MRPKSGLPKRKALKRMPVFVHGFKDNPETPHPLHDQLKGSSSVRPDTTSIVSFFCGCGGLDLGFLGGFKFLDNYYEPLNTKIVAAYDNDAKSIDTYHLNLDGIAQQIDLQTANMSKFPHGDVLIGGFPCQDFSSSGHKKGFATERGRLYRCMINYMQLHKPKIVIGENVPLLKGLKGGDYLSTIVHDIEAVGYRVITWFLNCPDFGLPASRKRIFIICIRDDLNGQPKEPEPTHLFRHTTIDEAIDDLIPITDESITNQSQYFVATRATGGAGQGDHTSRRGEVGYAVRANAKARIHFHYELPRRLTVRECARLQSFPDQFVFPFSTSANMMQIGNAVPPIVGHHVARSILEFLHGDLNDGTRVAK